MKNRIHGLATFSALFLAGCYRDEPVMRVPAPMEMAPVAAADPAGKLDLDALLSLADERNPAIRKSRTDVDAAHGRATQAGLWPNPELQARTMDRSTDELGSGRNLGGLAQSFPIGGRLPAARSAARAEIAALEYALEDRRHIVFGEVHQLYVEMIFLRRATALQWRLYRMSESLADRAGGAETAEASRARLQAAHRKTIILTLITRQSLAELRLGELLGGVKIDRNQIAGDLTAELDPAELAISTDSTVDLHPAVLAVQSRVAEAQRRVQLARRRAVPDLTVFAGGGYDDRDDESVVEAGVSIPIPIFDRNQGSIVEAEAETAGAMEELDGARARIHAEIEATLELLNELDTLVHDYRTILLPESVTAYEETMKRFENGDASFQDALDVLRTRIETEVTALDYSFEMNRELARLRHLRRYEGAR